MGQIMRIKIEKIARNLLLEKGKSKKVVMAEFLNRNKNAKTK